MVIGARKQEGIQAARPPETSRLISFLSRMNDYWGLHWSDVTERSLRAMYPTISLVLRNSKEINSNDSY